MDLEHFLARTALKRYDVLHAMTADIRQLIDAEPFIPFTIHTADGGNLRVPTIDHVAVLAAAKRIFVFSDDGGYEVLSPLLIARLSVERGEPVSSQDA